MAKNTINTDDIAKYFKDMYHKVITYFKGLSQDMVIAWSVLGVGIVVLIVAICV